MRLALHWRTLGAALDVEELLDAAAAAGFAGVEASAEQMLAFAKGGAHSRLVRRFAASGLSQAATELDVDLQAPESEFRTALGRAQPLLYVVRGLASFGAGEPALVVRAPAGRPGSGTQAGTVAARLRRVAAVLAAGGLRLLLDAAAPPRPLAGADLEGEAGRVAAWARQSASGNVGVVVDAWRWPALGSAAAAAARQALRGLPLLGRLADVPRAVPPAPEQVARLLPGQGGSDLAGAVRALRALGHDGYWSVEVGGLPGGAAEAARLCRRAGERVLRDAVRFG